MKGASFSNFKIWQRVASISMKCFRGNVSWCTFSSNIYLNLIKCLRCTVRRSSMNSHFSARGLWPFILLCCMHHFSTSGFLDKRKLTGLQVRLTLSCIFIESYSTDEEFSTELIVRDQIVFHCHSLSLIEKGKNQSSYKAGP